jgi:predicted nucleic-acid-binding Zn-ribbon protein
MPKSDNWELDITKVQAWINEHRTGSPRCPTCGTNRWEIPSQASSLELLGVHKGQHGLVPTVAVICEKCGHIQLYSAMKMGAMRTS